MITSATNNFIKQVTSLHHKKGRKEHKLYLAEGIHLVREALRAKVPIQKFVWTNKLLTSEEGRLLFKEISAVHEGVEVSEAVFDKLAETETPQGITALIELPDEKIPDFSQISLGLVIDGVQDPGNLGTIIRTAWAAGVEAIFCTSDTADPYQNKVVRSTMGGIFNQNIYREPTPQQIYDGANAVGLSLIAGYPLAKQNYFELDLRQPSLFLVGSEGRGLNPVWKQFPLVEANIPQPGQAESLNVAVTASIMIYEAVRQRLVSQK